MPVKADFIWVWKVTAHSMVIMWHGYFTKCQMFSYTSLLYNPHVISPMPTQLYSQSGACPVFITGILR